MDPVSGYASVMRHTVPLLSLALLLPASTGCRSTDSSADPAPPPVAPVEASWITAGVSVEGRPIDYTILGDGAVTVFLIGGIHGNEEAGTPLLLHLAELIARSAEPPTWMKDRRVVILPESNPDGLAANQRRNARNVDLNRNFPSRNFWTGGGGGTTPLSEPESQVIHQLIEEFEPDRILTFHMPVNVIDFDGPARGLARAMGEVSPLPVKRIGSRAGSLGSYAGLDLGIPIVTVELPASARELELTESWALYGPMILAAIEYER